MASGTGGITPEAVAANITTGCVYQYSATPNGTIKLTISPKKNPVSVTGFAVVHSFSNPYKTDVYWLVMRSGYYSGSTSYTNIINNTGLTATFAYDPQTQELTVSLPTSARYMACTVFYIDR